MKKKVLLLAMMLVLLLCGDSSQAAAGSGAVKSKEPDQLEVHFIDVGQGDATLIKCGDEAMLIDAGENDKGTFLQNYMRKQKVTSLSYLIVTHPDADHCGSADVIVTKYDIDTIIMPNYEKDTATYRDMIEAMDYRKYENTLPEVGDIYTLGDATFTIIAPNKEEYGETVNNYSVGILLEHGEKKFLFTGDAEAEAEADILDNGILVSADVLKAGHHGSKSSTGQALVQAVSPDYAVISCGENNDYGIPHAEVLNTLRASGVKLFRTDEQGSLIAYSDGRTITWNAAPTETWKAGEPTGQKAEASGSEKQKKEAPALSRPSYILNAKTKKFHLPSCSYLPTTNRRDTTDSRDDVIAKGYDPCKKCDP